MIYLDEEDIRNVTKNFEKIIWETNEWHCRYKQVLPGIVPGKLTIKLIYLNIVKCMRNKNTLIQLLVSNSF